MLPELCNSGYVFETRDEAFALAETVPDGPTTRAWVEMRRAARPTSSPASAERAGDGLYNSAVVIGPDGHVGTFRKVHLWNEENLYLRARRPRLSGVQHAARPDRHLHLLRCLVPRDLPAGALQGADIVCVPTNWVPIPGQDPKREAMANILAWPPPIATRCSSPAPTGSAASAASRSTGRASIVSYTGWPVAGPASRDREEIVYAEVDLADARRKRNWNTFNQVLRDRRDDVYDEMLGSGAKPGWY